MFNPHTVVTQTISNTLAVGPPLNFLIIYLGGGGVRNRNIWSCKICTPLHKSGCSGFWQPVGTPTSLQTKLSVPPCCTPRTIDRVRSLQRIVDRMGHKDRLRPVYSVRNPFFRLIISSLRTVPLVSNALGGYAVIVLFEGGYIVSYTLVSHHLY